MKIILKAVSAFLILASTALAQNASGQSSPTYQQTSNWIASKITDQGGKTDSTSFSPNTSANNDVSYSDVSLNDCNLRMTLVAQSDMTLGEHPEIPGSHITMTIKVFVPLNHVTLVHAGQGPANALSNEIVTGVDLHTSGKHVTSQMTKSINGKVTARDSELPPQDVVSVFFGHHPETDIAIRMQKAFSHAVDICKQPKPAEVF
jgi:hypothetical protein